MINIQNRINIMNTKSIVENINRRFSSDFGWPEGFIVAKETADGGFTLKIGRSDIQFDAEGNHVGGGTDLTNTWDVNIVKNDNDPIETKVIEVISRQMGLKENTITMKSTIESIGMDSLDEVELEIALEEEFGIDVSDEYFEAVTTIQDIVDLVVKKTRNKG